MLAVVLDVSPDSLSKETLMINLNVLSSPAQPQQTVPIEQGLQGFLIKKSFEISI
jgi:hypothetical protein